MPRKGIINGNGYECDICCRLLKPHDVFRVRCIKTVGHTGELRMLDSIGVCEDLPKTTKLMIDGQALYIHRANFQIIDKALID